jgi:hypothetical protein
VIGAWTPEQLRRITEARELEICGRRADGQTYRWLPIWVVCVGEQVYVRTWYRRTTGWFGQVTASGRARIRVAGVELDVAVADLGAEERDLRRAIDQAYRAKYGTTGDETVAGMITDTSAATTLWLTLAAQQCDELLTVPASR